jgi:hypothetical protein
MYCLNRTLLTSFTTQVASIDLVVGDCFSVTPRTMGNDDNDRRHYPWSFAVTDNFHNIMAITDKSTTDAETEDGEA